MYQNFGWFQPSTLFILQMQNIISNDSNDMTECKKSSKTVLSKCRLISHDIPWLQLM